MGTKGWIRRASATRLPGLLCRENHHEVASTVVVADKSNKFRRLDMSLLVKGLLLQK
jgi:hypothetical protein